MYKAFRSTTSEFLPSDREGMHDLAEALGLPLSDVVRRVETMGEYNPMLGMREYAWALQYQKSTKCKPEQFLRL